MAIQQNKEQAARHSKASFADCAKNRLRSQFQEVRAALPFWRRQEASEKALSIIKQVPAGLILSYASFQDELDTGAINSWLASQGRLVLPKVQGDNLALYHVTDPPYQLEIASYGVLEPMPGKCRKVSAQDIALTLVPGLAFDASLQRLGYGGGYYDRFLPSQSGIACGLGFREQYYAKDLPVSPTDVPLHRLWIF